MNRISITARHFHWHKKTQNAVKDMQQTRQVQAKNARWTVLNRGSLLRWHSIKEKGNEVHYQALLLVQCCLAEAH